MAQLLNTRVRQRGNPTSLDAQHHTIGRASGATLDPLSIAWRWEDYMHNAVGYSKFRLVKQLEIKPKYRTAFVRLTAYLKSNGMTADQYFGALAARAIRSRGEFRPWTQNLGLPHYNAFVQQELERQSERLAGNTSRPDAAYNRLPRPTDQSTDAALQQDVLKEIAYRRQYPRMSERQFWLLFLAEFTGAFLSVNESFRRANLNLFLSESQQSQMDLLASDAEIAEQVRRRCDAIASKVGTQAWPDSNSRRRGWEPKGVMDTRRKVHSVS